jgi:hypothetical protein
MDAHETDTFGQLLTEAEALDTTSTRLEQIFQEVKEKPKHRPIVRAVMRNPNTPAQILSAHMTTHIDAFCENPVAPLLLLELPGLLEGRHDIAVKRLLRRAALPAAFALYLAGHKNKNIAESARYHVGATGEVDISGDGWQDELVHVIAQKMPKKSETLHRLHAFGFVPEWLATPLKLPPSEIFSPLKNPYIPSKMQYTWQQYQDKIAEPYVFDYPLTPEEKLIVDEGDWYKISAYVAQNCRPSLSYYLIDKCLKEPINHHYQTAFMTIYYHICINKSTPIDLLESLVNLDQQTLLPHNPNTLLHNPNTPIAIIHKILIDYLEGKPAVNKVYGGIFLFRPDLDRDILVRFAAKNEQPSLLLTRDDIDEDTRKQIFVTMEADGQTVPTRFIALLHHANTNSLRKRSRSHEWMDRLGVALNPHSEKKILTTLRDDGNRYVRTVARARVSGVPIRTTSGYTL